MSANSSFLPDDYLDQRSERRTNIMSLVLFVVVMLGVFMAFLFTNHRWSKVRTEQQQINARYQEAAGEIGDLRELKKNKTEMLHKAELAAALVERVPRSFLLAEMINRMPERLSLLEFDLTSEKVRAAVEPTSDKATRRGRLKPRAAKTKKEAAEDNRRKKIPPPKYDVSISLVGVASSGQEVSRYLAALNAYPLPTNVTLEYTEERDIEGQVMQQFKVNAKLAPDADVRDIELLVNPKTVATRRAPVGKTVPASAPDTRSVSAETEGRSGD